MFRRIKQGKIADLHDEGHWYPYNPILKSLFLLTRFLRLTTQVE